jgi:hypothetical protein
MPAPTFTATGLPSWLSLNAGTGTLSGTPAATGTTGAITVTARNSQGSDAFTFTITVKPGPDIHVEAENYSAMSGVQTEACSDVGSGQNVGYIDATDWMDYAVNVSTAGSCTVEFRVASGAGGGQLQLKNGATVLATVNVPNTGAWQTWRTVSATVALSAGAQTLRVSAVTGGWNINWMDFYFSSATVAEPFPRNITADQIAGLDGMRKIYRIDGSIVSPSAGRETMKTGIYITQAKGSSVVRRMVEVR